MIYVCWGPAFLESNLVRFDLPPICKSSMLIGCAIYLLRFCFLTLLSLFLAKSPGIINDLSSLFTPFVKCICHRFVLYQVSS